ncbi:polysaccharide deacetylase family protein [Chloroflexota bacterium]
MEIQELAAATANRLGFLDAYSFLRRKLTKSQVAILMYHRVCPLKNNWGLEPISPQDFESQIEYFCRNYEILPLGELVQYVQQKNSFPEKAVVITIDDGYKDNYLYAYPILRRYHIPATVFLTTGHIGKGNLFWFDKVSYIIQHTTVNQISLDELGSYSLQSELDKSHAGLIITERLKRLPEERKNLLIEKLLSISGVDIPVDLGKELILSWDEIKEMSSGGIHFGAHSVNHPILTNMPLEQAEWEIAQSKKDIEEKLGKEVTAFSYPNGDFSSEIAKFIKESGFTCAVSVLPSKLISSQNSPYELSRIGMKEFNKFKVIFSGLWEDLQGILTRGKR